MMASRFEMGGGDTPDLTELLGQMFSGGYSNLSPLGTATAPEEGFDNQKHADEVFKTAMETFDMAQKIANVFKSNDGPEVLAYYKNMTLRRVQFDPEATNVVGSGFFHGGEANIVLHIMLAIERAEKGPPERPVVKTPALPEEEET